MNEIREVPGFANLLVTDDGVVLRKREGVLRRVAPYRRKDGYVVVGAREDGRKHSTHYVHRLVLLAFAGPPPFPGAQARHLDGSRDTNTVQNLTWGGTVEQVMDRVRHGRVRRGAACPQARLSPEQVFAARAMAQVGVKAPAIGRLFGVSRHTIYDVLKERTWKPGGGSDSAGCGTPCETR